MKGILCTLALSLFSIALGGQLDISRCTECDAKYTHWLRNRTRSDYWRSHDSPQAAGDHICRWTADLYYNCYSTCARNGDVEIPYVTSRKPLALKRFENEHCLAGACRLADTQSCAYLPPRRRCDSERQACISQMLEDNKCDESGVSTPAERRAFAQTMIHRMQCHLSYPDNKVEGKIFTLPEEQGLQQCKDIIITECLKSWSDKPYDLEYITNMPDVTSFCSGRDATVSCLQAVSNGTVDYHQHTYTSPCKSDLLKNPDEVQHVKREVIHAYDRLCSNTTNMSDSDHTTQKEDASQKRATSTSSMESAAGHGQDHKQKLATSTTSVGSAEDNGKDHEHHHGKGTHVSGTRSSKDGNNNAGVGSSISGLALLASAATLALLV